MDRIVKARVMVLAGLLGLAFADTTAASCPRLELANSHASLFGLPTNDGYSHYYAFAYAGQKVGQERGLWEPLQSPDGGLALPTTGRKIYLIAARRQIPAFSLFKLDNIRPCLLERGGTPYHGPDGGIVRDFSEESGARWLPASAAGGKVFALSW